MRGHYADLWQAVARALPEPHRDPHARWPEVEYARFIREAGALAASLADSGLRRGDAVAILLYNRPEFLIALLACLATGMTPVPLNFQVPGR